MNSVECAKKIRKEIGEKTKTKLLQHCGFSCSICGRLPIVFHHIEEWSVSHSNDEEILMPICPICHAKIHGEDGPPISKQEQYLYKNKPVKPQLLHDTLLPRQMPYAFFVGSNFIAFGNNIPIFNLPDGHELLSINVENGLFRLSVLAEADNNNKQYLIKDNELILDTEDIWDMRYSGSRLKIIKINNGKETVFVDINFHEDAVILRQMNTSFNGKSFQVRKLRKPWKKQVAKIEQIIKELEQEYYNVATEIDNRPQTDGSFGGRNVGDLMAEIDKMIIRHKMEQWLSHEYYKNFKWDWYYYQWVLDRVLKKSPVFGDKYASSININDAITAIKEKYKRDFEELEDVIVEYNGIIWQKNIYAIAPPNPV